MWQQPPGKEPGPASVTRFLRDRAPRPGSRRVLGGRRTTWACDPRGSRRARNTPSRTYLHHCPPAPALVQPAAPGDERGGARPRTIPLAQRRGAHRGAGLVARATGRSPSTRLGAGRPPEYHPPDAHIRAQEGVGPALSRGPEPGTGSPGICQVPGRARAPGWLVPTSLAAAPGAPTADWLGPTQLLWGRVLPGRPSPAGPRLPAGLGRTSPPARRGAEGRASASRRPGAWAGWHDWMPPPSGGVPFLSARRSGAPPP